ncbi:hypothetical protein FHS57_004268 [Runella defluvii]|uniref:DUF4890 domain-containing protein n=1 Tax=Runella defluvii TaxID=370973 RepID=A0A7W5ZNQ1_9BACT|nr:hypothetical protein [Runella defluvii]MBB3840248.1 hypothetical protein [Runella defluvii]HAK79264.1 hypothetical protein [Runella sp.]HAO50539.1 hypothetical protein [Runella sp.]
MKKTIVTIAAFAILGIANVNAQRDYRPAPAAPQAANPRVDNALEELNINRLDNVVKLTRKQENEIKRIEDRYDRLFRNRRLSQFEYQRLQREKQQDIWSVLTPAQRDRWTAYHHSQRFDNRPYRRG